MSTTTANLLYLFTIAAFILALRFLSSPRHARLGGQHGPCVPLEKREIGAVAADRGLDGEAAGALGIGQRPPDERDQLLLQSGDELIDPLALRRLQVVHHGAAGADDRPAVRV